MGISSCVTSVISNMDTMDKLIWKAKPSQIINLKTLLFVVIMYLFVLFSLKYITLYIIWNDVSKKRSTKQEFRKWVERRW